MFFLALLWAIEAHRAPVRTGPQSVIGRTGTVRGALTPRGTVRVGGELWSAEPAPGTRPLRAGARVQVAEVDGLRLLVEPAMR